MILQRLASAIRHQNWSQIITEIFILVIGIFLALQVQEWNEERKDNLLARQTLENLKEDFSEILEQSKSNTTFHINLVNSLQQLLICVDKNCPKEELDQLVPQTIKAGDGYELAPPQSNAYMELVNAGNINLIKYPELRAALFRADTNMSSVRQFYGSLNDTVLVFIKNLKRHVHVDVSSLSPLELKTFSAEPLALHQLNAFMGTYTYDWDAMRADPEFRLALEQILRIQVFYTVNQADILQEVTTVAQMLEVISPSQGNIP